MKKIEKHIANKTNMDNFHKFQNSVLKRNEDSLEGIELVDSAKSGSEEFIKYYKKKLMIDDFGKVWDLPTLPKISKSPQAFLNPPPEVEWGIYESLKDISLHAAREPLFWNIAHVVAIEKGVVEPYFFMFGAADSDKIIRNILRRMGGVPAWVRGRITTLQDCPSARAWWRCRLTEGAVKTFPKQTNKKEAHKFLHSKNPVWTTLTSFFMSRLVILSDPTMQAAIIASASKNKHINSPKDKTKPEYNLELFLRHLARTSLNKSFGFLSPEECYAMAEYSGRNFQGEKNNIALTPKEKKKHVLKRDGNKCKGCDREFDDSKLHTDSQKPYTHAGGDDLDNLILLCDRCKLRKKNSHTLLGLREENEEGGAFTAEGMKAEDLYETAEQAGKNLDG